MRSKAISTATFIKRPFTDDERAIAVALSRIVFLPGSFDKRFARDMSGAASDGLEITEKQAALLRTMAYRYRRQLPKAISAMGTKPPG